MQQYNYPTIIYYGAGSVNALADKLQENEYKKILIVTDKTLVNLGISNELIIELEKGDLPFAVFDGTQPNPTDEHVQEGLAVYREQKCDSIIALGGGSPIDTAKVIKIMVSHPPPLSQYEDGKGGDRLIINPMPPLYAIPTTAGTGSEVGRSAVIIMKDTGEKTIFFHPELMPSIAVLEPKFSRVLPPQITAATGIDAFSHNLEAYLASGFHPMADGIALEGIKLIISNLPVVYKNGNNLDARGKMLMAASMGATAFQKGLGMIHSLAHPLSAKYNMHHGLANALLLPFAVAFLEKSDLNNDQKRRLEIVLQLFIDAGFAEHSLSEACKNFFISLGIEFKLSKHSVPESDLEVLSEQAFRDPCHATNMIPVTKGDLLFLYKSAF
jgi:4-hydroxybutyrate dehydrogenase